MFYTRCVILLTSDCFVPPGEESGNIGKLPAASELVIEPVDETFVPDEDYYPIKKKEFTELWAHKSKLDVSRPVLLKAEYEIRYSSSQLNKQGSTPHEFTDGTFTAQVQNTSGKSSFLPLSPLDIKISDLLWESSPAIWGSLETE
ncbi:MAG: hypothetical protein R3C11_18135 [Planctomycetaceae bacterium]